MTNNRGTIKRTDGQGVRIHRHGRWHGVFLSSLGLQWHAVRGSVAGPGRDLHGWSGAKGSEGRERPDRVASRRARGTRGLTGRPLVQPYLTLTRLNERLLDSTLAARGGIWSARGCRESRARVAALSQQPPRVPALEPACPRGQTSPLRARRITVATGSLANHPQPLLLVAATEHPACASRHFRPDDVVNPRTRDACAQMTGIPFEHLVQGRPRFPGTWSQPVLRRSVPSCSQT